MFTSLFYVLNKIRLYLAPLPSGQGPGSGSPASPYIHVKKKAKKQGSKILQTYENKNILQT
jgi:hypothetical protein